MSDHPADPRQDDKEMAPTQALGMGSAAAWETVRQTARRGDPDRYTAALLAAREVRDDLVALAAFFAELTRIPSAVREPMMGEIRLQWWRDQLPLLARGERSGHPVADRLGGALRRHDLPMTLLTGMTEALAFDLYDDPFPDRAAQRAYIAKTQGTAFALALRIVGAGDREAAVLAEDAAQVYGRALGLVRLPVHLAAARCPIASIANAEAAIEPGKFAAPSLAPAVARFLADEVADIRRQLAQVAPRFRAAERRARVALLPVALVEPYLQALERCMAVDLRTPVTLTPLQRAWRLWRAVRSGAIPASHTRPPDGGSNRIG